MILSGSSGDKLLLGFQFWYQILRLLWWWNSIKQGIRKPYDNFTVHWWWLSFTQLRVSNWKVQWIFEDTRNEWKNQLSKLIEVSATITSLNVDWEVTRIDLQISRIPVDKCFTFGLIRRKCHIFDDRVTSTGRRIVKANKNFFYWSLNIILTGQCLLCCLRP